MPPRISLDAPSICIGRGDQAVDVQLDSNRYPRMLSRQHARLEIGAAGAVRLYDLGGRNGTFVNGARLRGDRALAPGDLIVFGQARPRLGWPQVSEVRYTFKRVHS